MFFYEGIQFFNTFILLTSITVLAYIYLKNPFFIIFCILSIYSILGIISFYAIETGAFIIELGIWSYLSNNLFIYSVIILLFNLTILIIYKGLSLLKNPFNIISTHIPNNQTRDNSDLIQYLLTGLIILQVTVEFFSIILFGDVFTSQANKVTYADQNPIISIFGSSSSYVSIITGFYFFFKKDRFYLALFLLHIFFLILSGQKFSGLVLGIGYFLSPFLISVQSLRVTIKLAIISFFSISIILAIFFANYAVGNQFSDAFGINPFLAMGYRLFYLTSHANWAILEFYNIQANLFEIHDFLRSDIFFVELLHPQDTTSSIENGVNFGNIFPGYLIYFFGKYFAMLFVILCGVLVGIACYSFCFAIASRKILLACLLSVLSNILIRAIFIGNIELVFSLQAMIAYFLISIYVFLKCIISKEVNNISSI